VNLGYTNSGKTINSSNSGKTINKGKDGSKRSHYSKVIVFKGLVGKFEGGGRTKQKTHKNDVNE
jgi:hypothetical protein